MQLPKLTPRQWFWSLMAFFFIWAYAGTRTQANSGSFMQSAQGIVVWPAEHLLVPGSWLATNAQGVVVWGFRGLTTSRQGTQTLASLEQENEQLKMDLATRDGQIAAQNKEIGELRGQRLNGFEPGDLVTANIVGAAPGAGADMIQIDKGSADHIAVHMPVIAGGNHIIGRVVSVGLKVSQVRLITDRGSHISAIIVRHVDGGTRLVSKEPCLVEGFGNGDYGSNTIKREGAAVEKGDIVQLYDSDWPAKLQYFTLGTVSSVGVDPNQPLRFEVHARANVNDIHTVNVLTRW